MIRWDFNWEILDLSFDMRLYNSLFSLSEKSLVVVITKVLVLILSQKKMVQEESVCNNTQKRKYK